MLNNALNNYSQTYDEYQRILNFDYVPYMEQGKVLKKGIASLPANEEESTTTVVLPLYRAE